MAFFIDAVETLRRLVAAVGTDLFIDSMAKSCERIELEDCKAKGHMVNNYNIRPPNSISISNMIRLLGAELDSSKAGWEEMYER